MSYQSCELTSEGRMTKPNSKRNMKKEEKDNEINNLNLE